MQQLKPFQIEGAKFLASRTRALLADEPGVGKTPQLCTAARLVESRKTLVVCPDIALEHWGREIRKWGLQGMTALLSWGKAHELHSLQAPEQWDVLVLDECHFGKNPLARRTKSVFAKGGIAYYAKHIWAASGTPAPNNVAELWPLLRAFGRTKMDQELFTRYFCHVDQEGKVRGNRADHIGELRAILELFTLRRKKRDVLPELGAIDVQEWYVKPKTDFLAGWDYRGEQVYSWNRDEGVLRRQLEGKSDEELLVFLAGDQEFATLRKYNALLKAPAVFETVKFELENDLLDKVVIYGYHKEPMAALDRAFRGAGISSTLIYGDTPRGERDALIEKWKRTPKAPLIASTIIANTALDFTAAHQGIMLEMTWVPGDNAQAMQRMHRYGQENPVTVRVAIGTPIDEIVSGVLIRKTKDLAEVFD